MAKDTTLSNRSPYDFAPGAPIRTEDVRDVVRSVNYAAATWAPTLFYFSGDLSTTLAFNTTSGLVTRLRGSFFLSPDIETLQVRATCTFPSLNSGVVRFTVGAVFTELSFGAGTTEQVGTIATSSLTPNDFVTFAIGLNHSGGSSPSCFLEHATIRGLNLVGALPDPPNE